MISWKLELEFKTISLGYLISNLNSVTSNSPLLKLFSASLSPPTSFISQSIGRIEKQTSSAVHHTLILCGNELRPQVFVSDPWSTKKYIPSRILFNTDPVIFEEPLLFRTIFLYSSEK